LADSATRQTSLTLRLGDGAEQLRLIRLDAFEALSQNFGITIEVLSLGELELLPAIGKPAAIESTVDGEHHRWFHGLVSDAEFLETMQGLGYVYRLTLAPAAHFVEHGSNFRIFQQTSLIDIVTKVLGERGIDHEVKASAGTRILPYCVQYGESDMAFVSRLMEEEGLYYFYLHSQSGHKLVICDKPGNHEDLPGGKLTFNPLGDSQKLGDSVLRGKAVAHNVLSWHERASSGSEAKVALHDYDFKKPETPRQANATERGAHPLDEVEIYTWPGRYYEEKTGEALSKVVLESRRAQRLRYEGTSRYSGIQVGYHVELEEHTIARFNRKYLVVRLRTTLANEQHRSGGGSGETFLEFNAIPNDVVFRAPLATPRPMVQGPETAVVTGPPGEEIHVDEYGRIKVQFHWDREGKHDDKSSCWVRVSQTGGLGNIVIPRIGHEVVVDFINGNPDRPLVVGRVFNAQHMPVYKLPDNKTRALWRTKTYKRDTGDSLGEAMPLDTKQPGANELRFEDATGAEELFVHAERDMNTRVRHNETHHTGRDVEIKVGKNRKEWVGIDETIDIEGDRKEHVLGTETVTIEKDRKVEVHTNDSLDVSQKIKIDAGDEIAITAANKITITVGGSSITLEPTKISIKTLNLDMQGTATAKLAGATVDIKGVATVATKAALITLN
jgi:type VI secretion system secreted protein VgrG